MSIGHRMDHIGALYQPPWPAAHDQESLIPPSASIGRSTRAGMPRHRRIGGPTDHLALKGQEPSDSAGRVRGRIRQMIGRS